VALVRFATVSPQEHSPASPEKLQRLLEARAVAEITAADALCPGADAVATRGALLARIAFVKGLPGPAEAAGEAAISGPDGEALDKALVSLGWRADEAFFTLSRPVLGLEEERYARRLRLQLEAVDPVVVVALDAEAGADLAQAFGCDPVRPGAPVRIMGRRLVALSGFEAGLADAKQKRVAWSELLLAAPPGPVY